MVEVTYRDCGEKQGLFVRHFHVNVFVIGKEFGEIHDVDEDEHHKGCRDRKEP